MIRDAETRLLRKKRLGSFYLADVRTLIEAREQAEARASELERERDIAYQQKRDLYDRAEAAERALAAVEALVADLRAIQAVAVMSQSPHAEQLRLEWLREIEDRSREALARFPATSPAKEQA